jgi:hypothetical protein
MVQRREQLRLAAEPAHPIRIVHREIRQDFDRYVTVKADVARAVDLPHAALSYDGLDFVGTQARTGLKVHAWADHTPAARAGKRCPSMSSAVYTT